MARTRHLRRGFTLVELMIVVAIIGVLAALAVYGVNRYVAAAKTAEAKDLVGGISRSAYIVFERERDNAMLVAEGGQGAATSYVLCGSAQPVPDVLAKVAGVKYQPSAAVGVDFETGTGTAGWNCLNHFIVTSPIHYRFTYYSGAGYLGLALGAANPGPNGFEAGAQGNLDGDGSPSTFLRAGQIHNSQLVMTTQLFVDNEFE